MTDLFLYFYDAHQTVLAKSWILRLGMAGILSTLRNILGAGPIMKEAEKCGLRFIEMIF